MHPNTLATLKSLDPGDIMQIEGPFNLNDDDKGMLDVAVLKRRGDEDTPMLDVSVSLFGIWLCDATMKVQKDKCLVHVTKESRDEK